MRLLQLKDDAGRRRVARVGEDKTSLDVLAGYDSTLELARDAIRRGCRLDDLVRVSKVDLRLEYDVVERAGQVRVPIDHPDPAHLLVSGTGITHLGSATARDAMHPGRTAGAERGGDSDSMRMFRLGIEGQADRGKAGVNRNGSTKDGSIIVPPARRSRCLRSRSRAARKPRSSACTWSTIGHAAPDRLRARQRIPDHGLEEQNYLYSRIEAARMLAGPELLLGDLPDSVRGLSRVLRAGETLWKGDSERRGSHVALDREPRAASFQVRDVPPSRVGALPLLRRRGAELRRGRAARRRVQARRRCSAAVAQPAARVGRRRRGRTFVVSRLGGRTMAACSFSAPRLRPRRP